MIHSWMTKPVIAAAYILASVLLAAGPSHAAGSHGDGYGKTSEKNSHMRGGHMKDGPGQGFNFGKPGVASAVVRTVEIAMKENYFEPETIAVKAGETIRFTIVNKGELVHEFNLGTAAMHVAHQKEMELMVEHGMLEADRINHKMMKMDMGGGETMEHDDPNSVLLEPGKSGDVIWTFAKAAELEFACNVPGHYEAGMMGNIRFN